MGPPVGWHVLCLGDAEIPFHREGQRRALRGAAAGEVRSLRAAPQAPPWGTALRGPRCRAPEPSCGPGSRRREVLAAGEERLSVQEQRGAGRPGCALRSRARLCRQPQQPFMNEAPEGEEGPQLQEQPALPFIHPLPFSNTMSYFSQKQIASLLSFRRICRVALFASMLLPSCPSSPFPPEAHPDTKARGSWFCLSSQPTQAATPVPPAPWAEPCPLRVLGSVQPRWQLAVLPPGPGTHSPAAGPGEGQPWLVQSSLSFLLPDTLGSPLFSALQSPLL